MLLLPISGRTYMNKFIITTAALCFSLLFSAPARAQHSGPYIGGFVGGGALMNAKGSDSQGDSRLSFKPALMEGGVVGWDLEPDSVLGEGRIELEYSRRGNTLDKVTFAEGSVPAGGTLTSDSLLLNCIGVFHDDTIWAPYLGLGAGAARIKADNLTVTGQALSNDSAIVFAYQVQAGFDIALTNHFSLDLGYRFFSTIRPAFTESNGRTFKMDYLNHSAVLGLRVGF